MHEYPDTIMLIHGQWMTPRSFEQWQDRYQRAGYHVLVPAWPGVEREVEAIRADPAFLGQLRFEEIIAHYEAILRTLERPPILMGHSFGGALVQVLVDHGFGAAGVAIHSFAVKGVYTLPLTTLRAIGPILINPVNAKRPLHMTRKQFHYAFTNTLGEAAAEAAYDRYYIPGAGPAGFQGALANFVRNSPLQVSFSRKDRAPLLFMAGTADHILPPAIQKENVRRYAGSQSMTEYREYAGRSHFTVGEPGWDVVADDALNWAVRNSQAISPAPRPPADLSPPPAM